MKLKTYQNKRRFTKTPEPKGKVKKSKGELRYFIQLHRATRLHYDFRLEIDGILKSWAVPKGPSMNPLDQRLAVAVEDHPMDYGEFEGVIPKGNYGAGTVILWDKGTYRERSSKTREESEAALKKGLSQGKLTIVLDGEKLKGEFALVKLKKGEPNAWLLLKKRDEHSSYRPKPKAYEPKVAKAKRPVAGKMPHAIHPMVPTPSAQPEGKDWQVLAAGEGVRAIAEINRGAATLYSRHHLSLSPKYPGVVAELRRLQGQYVIDGEIVKRPKPAFRAFDLLYENGKDLRPLPLKERFKRLQAIKGIETARKEASSVLLVRDLRSAYESGIHASWRKVKGKADGAKAEAPALTNLKKIYFPKEKITKGDVLEYYKKISPVILPHLRDRPESLHRHPNGIDQKSFFQKDLTGYLPRWMETARVYSESSEKTIHYALCQDERSLLYLANLGCIELNPWISRVPNLDNPDYVIIDLDPDDSNTFAQVIDVARAFHRLLDDLDLPHYAKTSGATGIHIAVPLGASYDFDTARIFAELACRLIQKEFSFTSVDRTPAKRRGKIYLDYLQNRRGQTLAAPYCIRPHPGAPVSTPLKWDEVKKGLDPSAFNIETIFRRVEKHGDLWLPVLTESVDIVKATAQLKTRLGAK